MRSRRVITGTIPFGGSPFGRCAARTDGPEASRCVQAVGGFESPRSPSVETWKLGTLEPAISRTFTAAAASAPAALAVFVPLRCTCTTRALWPVCVRGCGRPPLRTERGVILELLYFDGCPSHEVLLPRLRELVQRAGVSAEIELRAIEDDATAQRERFLGSPTVRVDGRDIESAAESRADFGPEVSALPRRGGGLGTAFRGLDPGRVACGRAPR